MPALAFFPWLTLCGPYKIGRYILIPRKKGEHPFGMNPDDQKIIDDVFEPYHDERGPVEGGIIAGVDDTIGFEDINDEQSSDLFSFAQIIKCSGLSARRFFDHLSYYNADNFVFIIQKFVPGEKGAAVTTKRRDGTTQTYFSGTTFREYCPKHAKPSQMCMMDTDLAVS